MKQDWGDDYEEQAQDMREQSQSDGDAKVRLHDRENPSVQFGSSLQDEEERFIARCKHGQAVENYMLSRHGNCI